MKKKLTPREEKKLKVKAGKIIIDLKKIFPKSEIALKFSNNWELYVAVVLSAQCTDKKVNEVTEKLFKKYKKFEDYLKINLSEFEQDIKSTGFYHNKAKSILTGAKFLKDHFKGTLPKTMSEMLTIPGVGRKTANVILGNAYDVVEGIAVDTHVIRLSEKLGLTDETDPVKIERDLMKIVPKKEWFSLTYRLIDYGRNYCVARPHINQNCPLFKYESK